MNSLPRAALATLVVLLALWLLLGYPFAAGGGLALFAYGVVRVLRTGNAKDVAARKQARAMLAGVVIACVVASGAQVAAYILFSKRTTAACEANARITQTLQARRAGWDEIHAHAWFADRVGRTDLEFCFDQTRTEWQDRGGTCAPWPMDDLPCKCVDATWPSDAHCTAGQRAFCGCLPAGTSCTATNDCCSGTCANGTCADGYASAVSSTLHCIAQ